MITPLRELVRALRDRPGAVSPSTQPAFAPGFPPLPDLATDEAWPTSAAAGRRLEDAVNFREGCYFANFLPAARCPDALLWPEAVGTVRLERLSARRLLASGDLYRQRPPGTDTPAGIPGTGATGDRVIPSFPRDRYHAYFRIGPARFAAERTGPGRNAGGPVLGAGFHRLRSAEFNLWYPAEAVTLHPAVSRNRAATDRRPRSEGRFTVIDDAGRRIGELRLRWISRYFREALLEFDGESGLPLPLDDGNGEDWHSAFARVGWRVRTAAGRIRIPAPASGRWSYADLHRAMVASRDSADLDGDWRYHGSVVRRFAEVESPLGIAFDHEATDLNGIPREGVAINAGARLPADRRYGNGAGRLLHECPALFFLVAAHELGHAMGLYHNPAGHGIMEQLDNLAAEAPGGVLDTEAVRPRFAADDLFRLRHLPDPCVRPGGTAWETQGMVEDHSDPLAQAPGILVRRETAEREGTLDLRVSLPSRRVPLGAPLRVDLELGNPHGPAVEVPARLSLATPFVTGRVRGPDGEENEFRSLFRSASCGAFTRLSRGAALSGGLTLLRGRLGSIVRRPGRHTLELELAWVRGGRRWCCRQTVDFEVEPPVAAAELRVARRLLSTAGTAGLLALGPGPGWRDAERVIDEALQCESLRRHFAYLKARALDRGADAGSSCRAVIRALLEPDAHLAVLSQPELARARRLRASAPNP